MKKYPWVQKVDLNICVNCYDQLFFGTGEFEEKHREEKFYKFLEGQKWAYDGWDSAPDMFPEPALFCCDMCGSDCVQDKYEISAARIVNADKFEDFMEAAEKCAEYIYNDPGEWGFLKQDFMSGEMPMKEYALHSASVILDKTEEFEEFFKEESEKNNKDFIEELDDLEEENES